MRRCCFISSHPSKGEALEEGGGKSVFLIQMLHLKNTVGQHVGESDCKSIYIHHESTLFSLHLLKKKKRKSSKASALITIYYFSFTPMHLRI